MWWGKRPPPLRVKSVSELYPYFRPRWVKVRSWGTLAVVTGFFLATGLISNQIPALMVLLVAPVLVHPVGAIEVFGLLGRNDPTLVGWHQKIEAWLQMDLDCDELRR